MPLTWGSIVTAPVDIDPFDADPKVHGGRGDARSMVGSDSGGRGGDHGFVAVHPGDLASLLIGMGRALQSGAKTHLDLRMWLQDDGWVRTTLVVSPLDYSTSLPFGFAAAPVSSRGRDDLENRLAALEEGLERIAAEVQSRPRSSSGSPRAAVLPKLSDRQIDIVGRLTRGQRVTTIARELGVSSSTVRNHLSLAFRKLQVRSQAELIELMSGGGD